MIDFYHELDGRVVITIDKLNKFYQIKWTDYQFTLIQWVPIKYLPLYVYNFGVDVGIQSFAITMRTNRDNYYCYNAEYHCLEYNNGYFSEISEENRWLTLGVNKLDIDINELNYLTKNL